LSWDNPRAICCRVRRRTKTHPTLSSIAPSHQWIFANRRSPAIRCTTTKTSSKHPSNSLPIINRQPVQHPAFRKTTRAAASQPCRSRCQERCLIGWHNCRRSRQPCKRWSSSGKKRWLCRPALRRHQASSPRAAQRRQTMRRLAHRTRRMALLTCPLKPPIQLRRRNRWRRGHCLSRGSRGRPHNQLIPNRQHLRL